MALPEPDRRAIQEGLIWSGDYKGLVDGNFGRGTRSAMASWAMRQSLPADGTLDAAARQKLATATSQARQAIGFTSITDPRTGAILGMPQKLLPTKTQSATGTRWTSADGAISLETRHSVDSDEALAIIFGQISSDGPGRKISYKALRPNFMVISGQTNESIFYTYLGIGPGNPARPVRGYTFTWPKGRGDLETVSLAVASAFQPFPPAPVAVASSGTTTPIGPQSLIEGKLSPPGGGRPALAGTSVALTPALIVTALGSHACNEPSFGNTKLKLLKSDAASGLAVFEATGAHALTGSLITQEVTPAPGEKLLVMFAGGTTSPADVSVTEGSWLAPIKSGGRARLIAALQAPSGGAVVMDHAGRVVGIVENKGDEVFGRQQGLVNIISTQEIAEFTGSLGTVTVSSVAPTTSPPDTGQIIGRVKPSLAGLFCH